MIQKMRSYLESPWVIALALLCIFLLLKGYRYGWDDHALEVPMLKSLVDDSLYQNDYYVQSLKKNFPSAFYRVLARLISVEQIPAAYFILFLLSRYFLFFFIYKFWHAIAKDRTHAFFATILIFTLGRIPEFFYRTFSHQEFALTLILAGLYFFYRDRYFLASVIFGLTANIHFLYSAFPMLYLVVYLLRYWNKTDWKTKSYSVGAFLICALPVIIVLIQKRLIDVNPLVFMTPFNWLDVYRIACPQNFIFGMITMGYLFTDIYGWLGGMEKYIFLVMLYLFNYLHNQQFRQDQKSNCMAFVVFIMCAISYYFTYYVPNRTVIDLNLVRNTQFMFYILSGYTFIFLLKMVDRENKFLGICAAIVACGFFYHSYIAATYIGLLTFILLVKRFTKEGVPFSKNIPALSSALAVILTIIVIIAEYTQIGKLGYSVMLLIAGELFVISLILLHRKVKPFYPKIKRLWVFVPLMSLYFYGVYYHFHYTHLEKTTQRGFWSLQRNWEEMQYYVKEHTPKSATLLVPWDMEMGGFRIHSDRSIVADGRDLGIVGFDYLASIEGMKRLRIIDPFKVFMKGKAIEITRLIKIIFTYHVDYIVFMNYHIPHETPGSPFSKIWSNQYYSLYRVVLPDLQKMKKITENLRSSSSPKNPSFLN